MTIELKIPHVGESIQEVQIGQWRKQEGDRVEADDDLVELETDKATMELPAPAAGVIRRILKQQGETVGVGETIAYLEEADGAPFQEQPAAKSGEEAARQSPAPSAAEKQQEKTNPPPARPEKSSDPATTKPTASNITPPRSVTQARTAPAKPQVSESAEEPLEEVAPMSLIRRRIAERLVQTQQTAALLTTFNEIDMSAVIHLRDKYGEQFRTRYSVKLGFMSFFVKSVIEALKECPVLNTEVRGTDIVYRNYFHIGIAIASDRGLVVPVLRSAEQMSFAEIEQAIGRFAVQARDGRLAPDDLSGGTFTISNGGVYGSLFSTPIVNPPQSGILGMHTIEDRPVARAGQVVIRPMMYVALTYDHRIVDGREAVGFLRHVKDLIEEPSRMLIET